MSQPEELRLQQAAPLGAYPLAVQAAQQQGALPPSEATRAWAEQPHLAVKYC